jgi:hypothetical protein
MSFANEFLKALGTSDNIKDYQHANRLFTDNNYRLSPKYGFLFHVAFDINMDLSLLGRDERLEAGMLAKTVDLPKFTVDNKTYNAYGRPNVVQTKIKYDQVNITFHDDSANIIRNFWYDYYSYYYRDSDYEEALYQQASKYQRRQIQDWGFGPIPIESNQMARGNYLRAIRIYSLHQKRFSEYVLINPIITNFRHGQHQNGENTNLLEHQMTIAYESVKYFTGYVKSNTISGFADLHYDKTPSPLTQGTNSIFGPGGLLNTADDIVGDLASGNIIGALFKGSRAIAGGRGKDFKGILTAEIGSMTRDILRGQNPLQKIAIPGINSLGINGVSRGIGGGVGGLVGAGAGLFGQAAGALGIGGSVNKVLGGAANGIGGIFKSGIPGIGGLAMAGAGVGAILTGGKNITNSSGSILTAGKNLLKNPLTASATRSIFPKDAEIINGLDLPPDPTEVTSLAFDDDGNLMPGYATNDETGEAYFVGENAQDGAVALDGYNEDQVINDPYWYESDQEATVASQQDIDPDLGDWWG